MIIATVIGEGGSADDLSEASRMNSPYGGIIHLIGEIPHSEATNGQYQAIIAVVARILPNLGDLSRAKGLSCGKVFFADNQALDEKAPIMHNI